MGKAFAGLQHSQCLRFPHPQCRQRPGNTLTARTGQEGRRRAARPGDTPRQSEPRLPEGLGCSQRAVSFGSHLLLEKQELYE